MNVYPSGACTKFNVLNIPDSVFDGDRSRVHSSYSTSASICGSQHCGLMASRGIHSGEPDDLLGFLCWFGVSVPGVNLHCSGAQRSGIQVVSR